MPLYALIDCAQDDRLYPLLEHEAEAMCLFGGPPDPALWPHAPHLVLIEEGSPLHAGLRGEGWHANWGLVCWAECDLKTLRRKLRPAMQAMLPDGRVVLFRFYDPRVWCAYLPTCTGEDLMRWFDGISYWWAPDPETGHTLRYALGEGGLVVDAVA